MFTGIITNQTAIKCSKQAKDGLTLTFTRPSAWEDMQLGESVSTDGVCLTVAALRPHEYDCFLMPETLHKTSFGHSLPAKVNLERPLGAGDRFGGHFVQGHVDTVGTVAKIDTSDGYQLFIDFPASSRNLVIPKGSIAINGVSLTVASVEGSTLSVALIPHTLNSTTLKSLKIGGKVNLEFDMIGKYIVNIAERGQLHAKNSKS